MSQKTDWFSGGVNPYRPGVYERSKVSVVHFSRWDGQQWCLYRSSAEDAAKQVCRSGEQLLPWRGLAQSPDPVDAAVAAGVGSGA